MASLLPEQENGPEAEGRLTEETLEGAVVGVVYASDDGHYLILRAVNHRTAEVVTLVGPLQGLNEGQEFTAQGKWERHKEYGRQFRVSSFKAVLPSTPEGIARYLASGIIPGIGEKLAKRIVDKFGGDTLKILDNYSQRLSEVSGLGKAKVKGIRKAWQEQSDLREQNLYMQSVGISAAYGVRILKHFGDNAALVIQNNPYQLTEVRGIGFRMSDAVARRMGIEPTNEFRLSAGVEYVVTTLTEREGHTCVPQEFLIEEAEKVLEVPRRHIERGLIRSLQDGKLVRENDVIFPKYLQEAECELATAINCTVMNRADSLPATMPVSETWRILNDEQRQAVRMAFRSGISIITGGPGVGKTTVTREIVHVAKALKMKISLAAPTGRAAKRLAESTGETAQTIHRLLKWEPEHGGFHHGRDQKLETDMVIIDEVSMLDTSLAASLFAALPSKVRLILVGDRDQLPSVGPGRILADLLSSGKIPVTHLSMIYRQAAGSSIVINAHHVNEGRMPNLRRPSDPGECDFFWIDQEEPERAAEMIVEIVADRIPGRFGLSPATDIQVLTPMNRGPVGAHRLNEMLQDRLNPVSMEDPPIEHAGMRFHKGDRVMQTVNNYDLGVFNGDMGTVSEVSRMAKKFSVLFDTGDTVYPLEDIDQLRLAYAITIHKSQGSEFPAVIVPLLTSHFIMLRRNLVYTAMTRAKQLLVLIGSRDALSMAVRNYKHQPRYTRLCGRLK